MKISDFSENEENKEITQLPKTFAWLSSITLISAVVCTVFIPHGHSLVMRIVGVSFLVVAPFFIFIPFYLLQKHGYGKDGDNYMQALRVVDKGLYNITRHPQYLGYMLMSFGFAAITQYWVVHLLTSLSIAFFYIQAVQEEHYCAARFGEPYNQYFNRVPRFNIIMGVWRNLQGKKND